MIAGQVFEPLVRVMANGELAPALAEHWGISADQLTYTFRLRNSVRFHDGTPLTTLHIRTMLEDVIRNRIFRGMDLIVGADDFRAKRTATLSGLTVHDATTFSIRLSRPYGRLLQNLAEPHCFTHLPPSPASSQRPVGTGPYQVTAMDAGVQRIELTRNPQYYGATPLIPAITLQVNAPRADLRFSSPAWFDRTSYHALPYIDAEVYFLGMNSAHPALRDHGVRRYVSSLLTEAMINGTLGSTPNPTGSFLPLGLPGYSAAPAEVEAAPAPATALPPAITVRTYLPKLLSLAHRYCERLHALGCACTVQSGAFEDLFSAKADGSLSIFLARFKPSNSSAEDLLSAFTSESSLNLFHNGSPQADALYEKIMRTPLEQNDELIRLYHELDELVRTAAWVRPLRYGGPQHIYLQRAYRPITINTLGLLGINFSTLTPLQSP